jgi:predicted transcriptional regulator
VLWGIEGWQNKKYAKKVIIIHGWERTLAEIGETLGVTRERVRQRIENALEKLRTPHNWEKLKDFISGASGTYKSTYKSSRNSKTEPNSCLRQQDEQKVSQEVQKEEMKAIKS